MEAGVGLWTEPGAVIRNLYFLDLADVGGALGRAKPGLTFQEVIQRLGPDLNLSSVVYCLGRGGTGDSLVFERALGSLAAFLDRVPFLQVTFRPVHTLPDGDLAHWRDFYGRVARRCKRFQDQGYREQILPRLRVFPVIFQASPGDLEQEGDFLEWLKRNFLLPSVVYPVTAFARGFPPTAAPAWERTFLTDSAGFDSEAILESLFSNALLDSLLTGDSEAPLPEAPLCRDSLILDSRGRAGNCTGDYPRGDWLPAGPVPAEAPLPHEKTGNPASTGCLLCIRQALQRSCEEFRLNRRLDSWQQVAPRAARWLRQAGCRQGAVDLLTAGARTFPAGEVPLALRLQKALCLYEQGALEEAMAELSAARQQAPTSAEVRHYQGLCEFAWRDYIEAADRFREALELGLSAPFRCEAEYFRGESHYHLREFDEALEALTGAEREGKGGSPVFFYQGLSWLGKGRPEKAAPLLEEALGRGPSPDDLFHVLFYLAFAAKEKEEYAASVAYCRRASAVNPGSQELHNLMGFCFFKQGSYDDAIACFEKAIEIDPASGIDYANLGSNLREKGDLEGAARMYRKALALDPSIGFARDSLARIEEKLEGAGSRKSDGGPCD